METDKTQNLWYNDHSPLQMKVNEEVEALEQDWNAQESDLDGIVNIHNQLFGSMDLFQRVSTL